MEPAVAMWTVKLGSGLRLMQSLMTVEIFVPDEYLKIKNKTVKKIIISGKRWPLPFRIRHTATWWPHAGHLLFCYGESSDVCHSLTATRIGYCNSGSETESVSWRNGAFDAVAEGLC